MVPVGERVGESDDARGRCACSDGDQRDSARRCGEPAKESGICEGRPTLPLRQGGYCRDLVPLRIVNA
jgi:hypothetical protein